MDREFWCFSRSRQDATREVDDMGLWGLNLQPESQQTAYLKRRINTTKQKAKQTDNTDKENIPLDSTSQRHRDIFFSLLNWTKSRILDPSSPEWKELETRKYSHSQGGINQNMWPPGRESCVSLRTEWMNFGYNKATCPTLIISPKQSSRKLPSSRWRRQLWLGNTGMHRITISLSVKDSSYHGGPTRS